MGLEITMAAMFLTACCLVNWEVPRIVSLQYCKTGPDDHLNLELPYFKTTMQFCLFSNFRYLEAEGSDVLQSLDGPNVDTELKNFKEILQKNRRKFFDEHFIDGKKRPEVSHHPLYVTVEQRVVAEDINNATKDEILRRIADKLQQVSDEDVRGPLSIKLQLLKAQPNKAKKDTLILLYNEIVEELGDLQAMQEACIPQDEGENDNQ